MAQDVPQQGLDELLTLLESDQLETRREALRTLCNLSFDDKTTVEIRNLGGIGPIIDCLMPESVGSEDSETTRAALRTLCNLSINDDNKVEIRLLGGLPPIVECLDSSDVRTRRDALRTLCNLSIDGENKKDVRPLGGIRSIVQCLDSEDADTRRYALASIINLSTDEENENEFRIQGGLQPVLRCAQVIDLETRRYALRSLCNLSSNADNKVSIAELQGLSVTIGCLQDEDVEVRCYALATLMHLCANDNNNAEATRLGGSVAVLQCMKAKEDDVRRYALSALSVLTTNEGNKLSAIQNGGISAVVTQLLVSEGKSRKHGMKALANLLSLGGGRSSEAHKLGGKSLVQLACDGVKGNDAEMKLACSEVLLYLCEDADARTMIRMQGGSTLPPQILDLCSEDAVKRRTATSALAKKVSEDKAAVEANRKRIEQEKLARLRSSKRLPVPASVSPTPRRRSPIKRSASPGPGSTVGAGSGVGLTHATAAVVERSIERAVGGSTIEKLTAELQQMRVSKEEAERLLKSAREESDKLRRELSVVKKSPQATPKSEPPSTGDRDLAESREREIGAMEKARQLMGELEGMRRYTQKMDDENNTLKTRVSGLEAQLRKATEQQNELRAQIDALQGSVTTDTSFRSESEKLRMQMANLQEAVAREKKTASEAVEREAAAAEKVRVLDAELMKIRSHYDAYVTQQQQKTDTSAREHSQALSALAPVETQMQQLQRELKDTKQALSLAEQQIGDYKRSQSSTSATMEILSDVRKQLSEVQAREDAANTKVLVLQQELSILSKETRKTSVSIQSDAIPVTPSPPSPSPAYQMSGEIEHVRADMSQLQASLRLAEERASKQAYSDAAAISDARQKIEVLEQELQQVSLFFEKKNLEPLRAELRATQVKYDDLLRAKSAAPVSSPRTVASLGTSTSTEKTVDQQVVDQLQSTKTELESANQKIIHLQRELEAVTKSPDEHSRIAALEQQRNELLHNWQSEKAQSEQRLIELTRLQKLLSSLSNEDDEGKAAEEIQRALFSAEKERQALIAEKDDLQKWADKKIAELEYDHEKQLSFVQQENEGLRVMNSKLEHDVVKARAAITAALEAPKAGPPGALSDTLTRLSEDLEKERLKREQAEAENTSATAKIKDLQMELDKQVAFTRAEVEPLNYQLAELRRQLENTKKELRTRLQIDASAAPQQVVAQIPAKDLGLADIERLQETVKSKTQENITLQQELKDSTREYEAKIVTLETELKNQLDFSANEVKVLKTQIVDLQERVASTTSKLQLAIGHAEQSTTRVLNDKDAVASQMWKELTESRANEESLQQSLSAAQAKIVELMEENKNQEMFSQREMAEAQATLRRSDNKIEDLNTQLRTLQKRVDEQADMIVERDERLQQLLSQHEQVRSEVVHTSRALSEVAAKADQHGNAASLLDDAQQKIIQLQDELGAQTRHSAAHIADQQKLIEKLQSQLADNAKEVMLLQHLKTLENELGAAQDTATQLSSTQQTASALKAELLKVNQENDTLRSEMVHYEEANRKIVSLQEELQRVNRFCDEERDASNAMLEKVRQEYVRLQSENKAMQTQISKMEETIVSLQPVAPLAPTPQEIEDQSVLDDNERRILLLEDEIQKQQQFSQLEIKTLQNTIDELHLQIVQQDAVFRERDTLRQELDRMKAGIATESSIGDRKAEEIEKLYSEKIDMLNQELAHQQIYSAQEVAELRAQIEELQAHPQVSLPGADGVPLSLEHAAKDLQELAAMNVEAKAQISALMEENYALKNDSTAADERIHILTEELKRQISYSEADITRLTNSNIELQEQLASALASVPADENSDNIRAMQSSVTSTQAAVVGERDSLKNQLRLTLAAKAEVEAQLKYAEEENRAAMMKISELQAEMEAQSKFVYQENNTLLSDVDGTRRELTETKQAYEELLQEHQAMREEYESQISKLTQELDHEVASSAHMARTKILQLEDELHHQVLFAKEEAEQMQMEFARSRQETVDQLTIDYEGKIAAIRRDMQTMQSELTAANTTKERLADELMLLRRPFKKGGLPTGTAADLTVDSDLQATDQSIVSQQATNQSMTSDYQPAATTIAVSKPPVPPLKLGTSSAAPKSTAVAPLSRSGALTTAQPIVKVPVATMKAIKESVYRVSLNKSPEETAYALITLNEYASQNPESRAVIRDAQLLPHLLNHLTEVGTPCCVQSLLMVSNMASDEQSNSYIRTSGLLPCTVACLSCLDDPTRQAALNAVRALAGNEESEKVLLQNGALEPVVRMLASDDYRIKRDAIKALRNLAASAEAKADVLRLGAIPFLIQALSHQDLDTVRSAMKTVSVLSSSPENRVALRELGGIAPIVGCLMSQDVETTRNAAAALINLSVNAKNKIEIRRHGGIQPVLDCLGSPDLETRRYSIRTICNLIINDDNRMEVRKLGGYVRIADLAANSQDQTIKRYSIRALANGATDEQAAIDMISGNAIVPLVECLRSKDEETIAEALNALCQLSYFEASYAPLRKTGAVRVTVNHLRSVGDTHAMSAPSLLLMSNMAAETGLRAELVRNGAVPSVCAMLNSPNVEVRRHALSCLGHLSTIDQVKVDFKQQDGMRQLTALLAEEDQGVISEALRVTFNMSTVDENRSAFRLLRGIPLVIQYLNHPNVDVQRNAIKCLYALSIDDENELEIGAKGGIPLVIACVASEDAEIRRRAISCLCNLSIHDSNKTLIRTSDGIPVLIQSLYSPDEKVVRDSMRALRNLAFDAESKADIKNHGGVEPMVRCLTSSDPMTIKYAARAVSILSVLQDNRPLITKAGGIPSIVACLRSPDEETKRSAVGCLINLSLSAGHKMDVRAAGGLPLVLSCLQSADTETVRYATRALSNLCINEDNARDVAQLNGTHGVLQCAMSKDAETQRAAVSCLNALSVIPETRAVLLSGAAINAISQVALDRKGDKRARRDCMRLLNLIAAGPDMPNAVRDSHTLQAVADCFGDDELETVKLCTKFLQQVSADPEVRMLASRYGFLQPLVQLSKHSDEELRNSASAALSVLATDRDNARIIQTIEATVVKI